MNEAVHYIYNVEHHVYWGILIALYFLYAGISAGAFFISSLGTVFDCEKFKPFSRLSAIAAAVFILAAPLHLLSDLERPGRFFYLFLSFNPASAISWGVWLLTAYAVVTLLYAWQIVKAPGSSGSQEAGDTDKVRRYGKAGLLLAVLIEVYTGLVLADVQGRAVWNTPLLPVLFMVTAVVSAAALLIIAVRLRARSFAPFGTEPLAKILGWFLTADLLLLAVLIIVLWKGDSANHAAAYVMLAGPGQISFLGLEVVLGLIAPLALLAVKWGRSGSGGLLAGLLALIGVIAMRTNIVLIGQEIPLTGDRLLAYHAAGGEIITALIIGAASIGALAVLTSNLPRAGTAAAAAPVNPDGMTVKS